MRPGPSFCQQAMIPSMLLVVVAAAAVRAQDCFKYATNCYACKSAGCGWCQIGSGNDISEGCQPADREADCRTAGMSAGLPVMWNQACPLLTASPAGTGGTTQSPVGSSNGQSSTGVGGSSQAQSSTTSGGAGGATGSSNTPVLTLNGATTTNSAAAEATTTTAIRASNAVPCNPACEICSSDGSSPAASRKKRACTLTWGEAKSKLVGNNCRFEVGSSLTAKWTDASCVVEEKACIPPKGSQEKPNYETCANPVPCERDTPGWKCSTCFIVADDGSGQHLSPNVAPVGCDAPRGATPNRLQLVLMMSVGACVTMLGPTTRL